MTQAEPWIQISGGGTWDYLNPKPDDVFWPDIAQALSRLPRFLGRTRKPYSVAQHSIIVCAQIQESVPDLQLAALLHDAHEAFTGDMPTPLKTAIFRLGGGEAWNQLVRTQDRAIHEAAGLPYSLPTDWREAIKRADLCALATEKRDLMTDCEWWGHDLPEPLPYTIHPMSADKADTMFQRKLRELSDARGGRK